MAFTLAYLGLCVFGIVVTTSTEGLAGIGVAVAALLRRGTGGDQGGGTAEDAGGRYDEPVEG